MSKTADNYLFECTEAIYRNLNLRNSGELSQRDAAENIRIAIKTFASQETASLKAENEELKRQLSEWRKTQNEEPTEWKNYYADFVCSHCGAKFSNMLDINAHIATHTTTVNQMPVSGYRTPDSVPNEQTPRREEKKHPELEKLRKDISPEDKAAIDKHFESPRKEEEWTWLNDNGKIYFRKGDKSCYLEDAIDICLLLNDEARLNAHQEVSLPSDEEIEKRLKEIPYTSHSDYSLAFTRGFIACIKWLRSRIKQ